MQIETGGIYHIKNEFFEKVKDNGLMVNHENGNSRPTYFTIKEEDILWFIPLSSKVEKYKKIAQFKKKKYGYCNTILIRKIAGVYSAILIQNSFPILEKYIDHQHTIDGRPVKVVNSLKNEVLYSFKCVIKLKDNGVNLFFTDVDNIKMIMLSELNC